MQQPRLFVRKFHQKEIYKYYSHNNHTWFTFITTRRRLFFITSRTELTSLFSLLLWCLLLLRTRIYNVNTLSTAQY